MVLNTKMITQVDQVLAITYIYGGVLLVHSRILRDPFVFCVL